MAETTHADGKLQRAILANAAFSAFTGSLAAGPTDWFGGLIGTPHLGLLKLFGAALLLHAVCLIIIARLPQIRVWAKINFALIAPYPLLMLLAIGSGLVSTPIGKVIAAADGLIVGAIAFLILRALKKTATTHA